MSRIRSLLLGTLILTLACGNDAAMIEELPESERRPVSAAAEETEPEASGVQSGMAMEPDAPIRFDHDSAGSGADDVATLEAAVAAAPSDPGLRRRLAVALHREQRLDEAIGHFETIAELRPDVRAWMDLGLAYSSVSRLPEAEQSYRKLLELSPGHPVALHNLGNLAFKRREIEDALSLYREALVANPKYLLAQFHLADVLKEAGSYREAYRAYARVLELDPGSPAELEAYDNALYEMASLDIKMGEFARAGEYLSTLIEANPAHIKAHYAYGQVLMQLGRPEEAAREFEAHLRVTSGLSPKPATSGQD